MLILCQHHYSESKVLDLCGLRPHNLSIGCNPVLSTEPTGPHCESLTMLSYIELSVQALCYDHKLFTRVYTLTVPSIFFPSYRKNIANNSYAKLISEFFIEPETIVMETNLRWFQNFYSIAMRCWSNFINSNAKNDSAEFLSWITDEKLFGFKMRNDSKSWFSYLKRNFAL